MAESGWIQSRSVFVGVSVNVVVCVVLNSVRFCLSIKVLISLSNLNEILVG